MITPTLRQRIAAGNAIAVSRLFDLVRAREGTYADGCDIVRRICREAGKPAPSDAEIDELLSESDYDDPVEGWAP